MMLLMVRLMRARSGKHLESIWICLIVHASYDIKGPRCLGLSKKARAFFGIKTQTNMVGKFRCLELSPPAGTGIWRAHQSALIMELALTIAPFSGPCPGSILSVACRSNPIGSAVGAVWVSVHVYLVVDAPWLREE